MNKKFRIMGITRINLFFILIFTISLSVFTGYDALKADEPVPRLVVIDDFSIEHDEDFDMTVSLLTALINFSPQTDIFLGSGDLGRRLPRNFSESDLSQLGSHIRLASNQTNSSIYDGYNIISDLISFLSTNQIPAGAEIFWFSRGFNFSEEKMVISDISPLLIPFSTNDWNLNIISLPTASESGRDLMRQVADSAGGHFFDVMSLEHLSRLINEITFIPMEKQLDNYGKPNTKSFTSIPIPPSSDYFKVNIVRENIDLSGEVFDPIGQKINDNYPNVEIIETPNIVMFTIGSPEPGNWMLETFSKDNSRISAFAAVEHSLSLNLLNEPPVPVGEKYKISAELKIKDEVTGLNGSWIDAVVTWSDNAAQIFQLKDDGLLSDEKANDGIFSGIIDTRNVQGINNVVLNLNWTDIGTIMVVSDYFQTEYFPVVDIQTNDKLEILEGDSVEIAKINITKDGYPYLTKPENIQATLRNNLGDNIEVRVTSVRNIDQEKAWEFFIEAFPKTSGDFNLQVSLLENYMGRNYKFDTASLPLNFELKILEPEVSYIQYFIMIPVVIISLVLAGYAIWRLRQVAPRGVLIDSKGELIVDFSNIKRSIWKKIIFPSVIFSSELQSLQIEKIKFEFSTNKLTYLIFNSNTSSLGLRINGKPALTRNLLTEDSSIGMGGRLYYFSPTVSEFSESWTAKTA